MESFFDNQFQFLKHFDVKAQGKPQRKKKKWLLSREYLQPLTEPEDEDSARDDQNDSPSGYKKKLKCAYEAAKYGMKEGVLTGVFLGGCWGIFKHLGENFTLSFLSSGSFGNKRGGERNSAVIPAQKSPVKSRRSSQKGDSLGSVTSTERNRTSAPRGSDVYQENISSYKESLSVMREKSSEKNYYNATTTNRLIYKFTNSKLPIRSERQYPPLRSGGAGIYETNRFNFRRSGDKVQIVGYAFIHTTSSVTGENSGSGSIKSDGSDSPKNTASTVDKEARKISSDGKSKTTVAGSSNNNRKAESEFLSVAASEENKSLQNGRQSVRSANKFEKSASSPIKSSRQSIRSTIGSSSEKLTKGHLGSSGSVVASNGVQIRLQTEHSRSTLPDVVEETKNTTPLNTNCSGSIKPEEDFQQWIVEQSDTQVDSSPEVSLDKQESKISGISSITYSNSSYREVSKVVKSSASTGNYIRKSKQETAKSDNVVGSPPEPRNIYPYAKKTASVLVDADSLSNGFTSPPMYLRSANQSSYQISEEQPESKMFETPNHGRHSVTSNISELGSKNPAYVNSASSTSAISRSVVEDQSRYRVDSSPKFNRSYISDSQNEGKYRVESSLPQERSYISDSQERRYGMETSPTYSRSRVDARSKAEICPSFKRSSLSETHDNRRYSAEGSSTSNRHYVSETHEGRFKSGSTPLHNRSYISETEDGKSYKSYLSEKQEESGFILGGSPTKSYISETQDEVLTRAKSNTSDHKPYVSATSIECNTSRTGGSRQSGSLFSGRGRDSTSGSAGFINVSGVQNQEKHSAGSPAHSKSAVEEIQSAVEKAKYSASLFRDKSSSNRNESTTNSYLGCEREVSAGAMREGSTGVANAGGSVSPPKRVTTEKDGGSAAVQGEEVAKKSERSSRSFGFLSAVNENIIVLSACNCAIVLGVVCSVISTTRASLAV